LLSTRFLALWTRRDRASASTLWGDVLSAHGWLAIWLALLITPLMLRGPLPPDELRYLSVAWEMWSRGDFLLPYLNGAPYSDKGPLLFWCVHAGWLLFGVNDWWPRSLSPIFALTAILLTQRLISALWPDNREAIRTLPWLLLGSLAWTAYTQVMLVDLLLVNCALLGLIGLVRAERGARRGWTLVAVGTALGLLTKGPAMLVHLAGAGLLAPWWHMRTGASYKKWYLGLAAALSSGALVALVWAGLATLRGGGDYGASILVHQTTGRVVESFAHAHPFWYYAAMLPLLFLPWAAWPAAWRALRAGLREASRDRGYRMMGLTIGLTFLIFSALSGKQPHYLLPVVPLLAALLAVSLTALPAKKESLLAPGALCMIGTLGVALLPLAPTPERLSVAAWSPAWGIGATLAILALMRRAAWPTAVRRLALFVPLFALAVEIGFFRANRTYFDTSATAAFVRELQDGGHPVARIGRYEGEFHFPARLRMPIEELERDPESLAAWSRAHPDGYMISEGEEPIEDAVFTNRIRGQWLSIVRAAPK